MKKIFTVLFLCVFALGAQAQDDAISKFFNKYEDDMSFTVVNITSRMFNLFTDLEVENQEDKEILDAISKLKGLRILAKEDTNEGMRLYKEAYTLLPKAEYEDLMTIRDQDQNMRFLIKEKDGKISELLMLMGGTEDFLILSLFGEIDLSQVAKISRKMDIDGLDHLDKLDKNNKSN
ncbi:MAG: DUF4252 domain-containing protein [Candidatus Cyclobacteriaceae bacterium M2_1C_046]